MKRVVLTGSESTGKTILAGELAAHFRCPVVHEYSRDYAREKGSDLTVDDVEPIARGWCERFSRETAGADLVILDTDLLSTLVYGTHYYSFCPPWIGERLTSEPADLYLLLDIDVPWVPDPQRDRGDRREEMQALFLRSLERSGLPFITIRGSWEERRSRAIEAVEAIL